MKIFEGDVVNYGMYSDGSGPCNYVVFWDADRAAFRIRAIYETNMNLDLDFFCKVIGNIHDNPELIQP